MAVQKEYKVKRAWRMTIPISPGDGSTRQHKEMSSSQKSRCVRGASAKKKKHVPVLHQNQAPLLDAPWNWCGDTDRSSYHPPLSFHHIYDMKLILYPGLVGKLAQCSICQSKHALGTRTISWDLSSCWRRAVWSLGLDLEQAGLEHSSSGSG